jgi:hypothetical protein
LQIPEGAVALLLVVSSTVLAPLEQIQSLLLAVVAMVGGQGMAGARARERPAFLHLAAAEAAGAVDVPRARIRWAMPVERARRVSLSSNIKEKGHDGSCKLSLASI